MSAHEMPTDMALRRPMSNSTKKPRPFAAIDNPTHSPSYDLNLSPSPSPVPDWPLVREDPSDHPEFAPRGRSTRGGATAVFAPSAGHHGHGAPTSDPRPCGDLQDLDSFLLEGGGCVGLENEHSTRSRDWLPDDYDDHPHAVSPKKRRVERELCNDFDEALDFPMQMPLPLEVDLDHATIDGPHDPHDMHPDMHHDLHGDMHLDMHPDMHPEMSLSYHEEEELQLHPMPMPMQMPRRHPHAHAHAALVQSRSHPQMHHSQDFMHEMEMFPVMEHEPLPQARRNPHARSPVASPHASPSPMQARRVASMSRAPRAPAYGARYMNAYVPTVPVPMGGGSPYYRRAYARPQQYRYINPANLPSSRVRKAYHLSPMTPERRQGHAPTAAYFMCPEEDPFHRQFFFPADPSGASAADLGMMDERSPSSVAAIDLPIQQQEQMAVRGGRPEMKRMMSLPAMKFASPDPEAKSSAMEVSDDRKPSPVQEAPAHAPVPVDQIEEKDEEVVHFTKRKHTSLAIEEDSNWLSEFQAYVRMEFLEIFRANMEDVKFRNTSRKVAHKQLGIRCRFCAHVHPGSRARRSSAYPSSTAQIYQSFNMMIRDHFPRCEHVPKESMEMFHKLKARNNQGAADSKHFWSYAAEKLGMVDSDTGIFMDEGTQRAALTKMPFSTTKSILAAARCPPILLVSADDRSLITPYLFELLSRVQRVNLLDCECRSTRKNLKVGLPGFGCRYCCEAGRLGFSRIFPTKRKGLPEKANDMYEHMRRCTLCPPEVKKRLESIRPKPEDVNSSTEKVFFDRVWSRLNGGVSS